MAPAPTEAAKRARNLLANRMRALRVAADLKAIDLATACGWHWSKVSRIEHARQLPSVADIRAWCVACRRPEVAEEIVTEMHNADSLYTEWRQKIKDGLRHLQRAGVPLHRTTKQYRIYETNFVPGLLQTRAYAVAVMRTFVVSEGLPDDSEQAADGRLARQQAAEEAGARITVVMEEAALSMNVGNTAVMTEQLQHLKTCIGAPNVSLAIIPASAWRNGMLPTSAFWIFDTKLVKIELLNAGIQLTEPADVQAFETAFSHLSAQAVTGKAAHAIIDAHIRAHK